MLRCLAFSCSIANLFCILASIESVTCRYRRCLLLTKVKKWTFLCEGWNCKSFKMYAKSNEKSFKKMERIQEENFILKLKCTSSVSSVFSSQGHRAEWPHCLYSTVNMRLELKIQPWSSFWLSKFGESVQMIRIFVKSDVLANWRQLEIMR